MKKIILLLLIMIGTITSNAQILGFVSVNTGSVPPGVIDDYPQDNAASTITEVNSIGGWVNQNTITTSDAVEFIHGLYSIKIESNTSGGYNRSELTVNGLVDGGIYDLSWKNKFVNVSGNNDSRAFAWTGVVTSPNIQLSGDIVWTARNYTFTTNATSVKFVFYTSPSGNNSLGDILYLDEIKLIKQ